MCHSVPLTESSCIQVGPFPAWRTLTVGLLGPYCKSQGKIGFECGDSPAINWNPMWRIPPPCYFNLINPASWYLDARKSYAQGWTYVLFKSSWVLLRSFQKNEMFSRSFAFFIKRTKHSLRSLTFFIKECGVLCVLLRSL